MVNIILIAVIFGSSIIASADEKSFRVISNNAGSKDKSFIASPIFQEIFVNVTAEKSSTLEVLCSAESDLPVTYQWLDPQDNKISDSTDGIYTFLNESGSWLHVSQVNTNNEGMYTCTAADDNGLSSKIFNILVIDENVTPAIVKVQAKVRNNSIAFLIHTVGKVDTIFVLYSEILSPSMPTKLKWTYGGAGPYEIKNLTACGKYDFKFRLSEKEEWSKSYTIVMLPDIPMVIFGGLSDGTLKLEWFSKFDNIMRGTIDKHELSYYTISQVRGNYWEKSNCVVTVEIPSCSTGYSISPLYKNSYYEIRLRAHTSEGWGEYFYSRIHA